MRRILLSFAAASAIVSAAALAAPASALTVGTTSAMRAALEETGMLDEVAYVCRHRYYTSRRVCWWRPTAAHGGHGAAGVVTEDSALNG